MCKYLLVKYKDLDVNFLIDFFKNLLNQRILVSEEQNLIVIKYESQETYLFEDSINALNAEFMSDMYLFASNEFNNIADLERNLEIIKKAFIPIKSEQKYFNEKKIMSHCINISYNRELKHVILGKYKDDQVMLDILRTFFKCNLNTSLASKLLYTHRNTLQNKLDRFSKETGFDVKDFNDAYILSSLINN